MNRRLFIKLSAGSVLPIMIGHCTVDRARNFPVYIKSDMAFGHLTYEENSFVQGQDMKTEILIVGGGIAGMAAAWQLKTRDLLLCELSNRLGGTSTALSLDQFTVAQGAHYDLAYPDNYGLEGLKMLEELNIIEKNNFSGLWEFRDKQYIIPPASESRCFTGEGFRETVLPEGKLKSQFLDLISPFEGEMVMPTRKINSQYHYLNSVSFQEYLSDKLDLSPDFVRGLDYNMRDDYGGDASAVSALAGIHYYMCRPYYTQPVELFSPPEGNYYFITRMAKTIPAEKIKTGCLVYKIKKARNGFEVNVLDHNSKERKTIYAQKIIYAGNKHVLKYSVPEDYPLFQDTTYAPWAIMNIVLKENPEGSVFWQNEIISAHPSLIGFVDSESQYHPEGTPRVLTVYFCLDPANRKILADIEEQKDAFVSQALLQLSQYFGSDIGKWVQEVHIRVFGHAMPVPVPGYLFQDKNDQRSYKDLVYAGVDNHRLPLFFEALDSGIQAAKTISR